MADNENALTQPKFKLGITGIIQMCFRVIRPQNKKMISSCIFSSWYKKTKKNLTIPIVDVCLQAGGNYISQLLEKE